MIPWRAISLIAVVLAPAPLCMLCVSANQSLASRVPPKQLALKVPGRAPGQEFYVAPNGTPGGNGSLQKPWDLATALAHPAGVRPGATIWVRGGSYGSGATMFRSKLAGTAAAPIVVREYPGERAMINGGLQIGCCDKDPHPEQGAYIWFWGLEIASTIPDRTGNAASDSDLASSVLVNAVDSWAPGTKLINLVIHDARQGIGIWQEARDSEVYGNLIYNNGFQASDRGHGHGIYLQNDDGTKLISDNIIFNQFGAGIHAYGSSHANVRNVTVDGNIVFNNGGISQKAQHDDNILFASGTGLENIVVQNNYTYHTPSGDIGYSRVGWQFDAANKTVMVRNNYWIGGDLGIMLNRWTAANFTGNTVYSKSKLLALVDALPAQHPRNYVWDRNTYYGSGKFNFKGQEVDWTGWRERSTLDASSHFTSGPPRGVWAFVRPNQYEKGRANIAIYNWDAAPTVCVDVSGYLPTGATYEIHDAENFFAAPVVSGVFDGKPIAIPMTNLTAAQPNGDVPTPPTHTAPEFGAFILRVSPASSASPR
jgi:parallel beta-helix repeat protein